MSLINLKTFCDDYDEGEVYYSEEHQRRKVWSTKTLAAFMESVCLGRSQLSTIVLADVKKCLKYSAGIGDSVSVSYFTDILGKGYRYISLDGQNRSKFIVAFMNNKFPISGTFVDADDEEVKINNKVFKDFPPRLRDRINGGFLNIATAPACDKNQLSDIFLALNSGVPLNSHEKRNSLITPIAGWVRNESKNLKDALGRAVLEKDAVRMLDDELVAKMAMVLMRNNPASKTNQWNLSSTDIDRFYMTGLGFYTFEDDKCPYPPHMIKRVEDILSMWSHTITKQTYYPRSKQVAAKMYWATLYVCEWIYDSKYYIPPSSYGLFFEKLKELDDELIEDSTTRWSAKRAQYIKNGDDPDEVSKNQYYFNWISIPHQHDLRDNRKTELINSIKANPYSFGLRKLAA